MAALYLHNAIFSQGIAPPSNGVNWSSPTVRALDEPVQVADEEAAPIPHPDGCTEDGNNGQPTGQDKERNTRRRLRLLRRAQRMGELVSGGWIVYTATRYFVRFTRATGTTLEILNVVLGVSSLLSLGFLLAHIVLSLPWFRRQLLETTAPIALHRFYRIILSLRLIATVFLVVPAVANFVVTFIWLRNSVDCAGAYDVDIIWGPAVRPCRWNKAGWIGMSVIRLVLTTVVVICYSLPAWAYVRTRHPSLALRKTERKKKRRPQSIQRPLMGRALTRTPSATAFPGRDLASSHTSSTLRQPSTSSTNEKTRSPSTSTSRSTLHPIATPPSASVPLPNMGDENELQNFADRFRALVGQISWEADEAARFAIPDETEATSAPPWPHHPSLAAGPYGLGSNNPYALFIDPYGHNELGHQYPPDEHIAILGGYVRRMPTIESLGSREASTSLSRSRGNTAGSMSFSESGIISRGNSLYLPGDMALPMAAGEPDALSMQELGYVESPLQEHPHGTGVTGFTSHSSLSYYTAVATPIDEGHENDSGHYENEKETHGRH
ncbi:hypothetical protein CYLTODRAFT_490831 [Cylindrobasidium torrendii FP15055 ss-10]|uniref:Uncharacterized protein n=1 Tax=Cylindrobasidium torrendii FP15055 ss-10 TaxID=1314674 RepID=A0A0D7BCE2_9AGAR|nr:hypothetical protein CYLTODRAFT_490831 [Cylindrobasidium torrendii FP15055 ss-10]